MGKINKYATTLVIWWIYIRKKLNKVKKKAKELISKFYERNPNLDKGFYALSGSYIYGFAGKDSDIDIKGFHIADFQKWAMVNNKPAEQFSRNKGDTLSEGFEKWPNVEFDSYELRKFGKLLNKGNPNVMEWIFSEKKYNIINFAPINKLKAKIKKMLPLDIHYHYLGMAKSNYHKYIKREKINNVADEKMAKKYLYVIRGLLGAINVTTRNKVNPNVLSMSNSILSEENHNIVKKLVEFKRKREAPSNNVMSGARSVMRECWEFILDKDLSNLTLEEIFKTSKEKWYADAKHKGEFKDYVDEWMLEVRNKR